MRRPLLRSIRCWAPAVLLLLGGCGDGLALDRLAAGEHGRVVEVRSGDVVALDSGLVVRLAGLQVPREGEAGSDEAAAALGRLVQGRQVQLYYGGARRDAYSRALAQVRLVGGGWVEAAMLRQGEAEVRTFADNRAMARAMLDDEARARLAHRGLWRVGGAFQVRLPQEVGRAMGRGGAGFQIVEGQVRRVTDTGRGVYLDFMDGAGGFAAEVPAAAAQDLREAGLSPDTLAARLVRVRGTVGWDGLMRIDHPEQVEVVGRR
ncbi:MAG: thermonuclease family protein [Caulobacteraceae bacterium]|nr:thermonuclease family protein [Caulobacteraceae bacterium]